jgi:hypothetical protein
MRVLVVARTRMKGDRVCVGGIDLDTGRSVRLLGSDGRNLSEDHEIRPGEVWTLVHEELRRSLEPPHVEDIVVRRGHKDADVSDLRAAILSVWQPWDCDLDDIFEGRLSATDNGTGFVAEGDPLPACSTGFWVSTRLATIDGYERYWFDGGRRIARVKYKGMAEPAQTILAGTLIRFSLARWAEFPPGIGERRCYLQLSGWYR